ncbi:hypothetical protein ABJI51_11645 [Amycolatopsis sp. NEAU-NG30]|uniref:TIR domain-containing protein n=1 Tax=Amycolatopsis melonis TaxID=3156488 RepID=A0ABV0LBP4_9PSEU
MAVVVTYAHDEEGKRLAGSLVAVLRARGLVVLWDGDLKVENVSSQPAWMIASIRDNLVVCVLSPDYARNFGVKSPAGGRRGVQFESHLVIEKFYNQCEATNCPIVPVAAPGFAAEDAPELLRSMTISRYDPDTGEGAEEIAVRLRRLGACEAPAPGRDPDDVLRDLRSASAGADAVPELMREWLRLVERGVVDHEHIVAALPVVEDAAAGGGGAQLLEEVTYRVLAGLNTRAGPGGDRRAKALVLIGGLGWLLRRRREFRLAEAVVTEGVELARQLGEPTIAALGLACLAHVHRGLAEDTTGRARTDHLRTALAEAGEAVKLLEEVGDRTREIGVCEHVYAHVWFTRYLLLGGRRSLNRAHALAERAAGHLAQRMTEHPELILLRAEISVRAGDFARAEQLVDRAVRALTATVNHTATSASLVGRAHMVFAWIHRRTCPARAGKSVEKALKIFDEAGLSRAADCSRWFLLTLDPRSAGIRARDVAVLERICPDVRVRLLAVEERRRRSLEKIQAPWRPCSVWRDIVRSVRGSAAGTPDR